MIWLFERGGEATRVETRFDNSTCEYVAEIVWADGHVETERYHDRATFHARILMLEAQLATERWQLTGPPTLISDAWRL